MWDILKVYGQFPQVGLYENMIYDMLLPVPAAISNATVNATVFTVDCSALPDAKQVAFSGDSGDEVYTFRFLEKTNSTAQFSIPCTYTSFRCVYC